MEASADLNTGHLGAQSNIPQEATRVEAIASRLAIPT